MLAGAGSGKTRVLTHRVAWLIGEAASARAILAITFTNKAAGEMRDASRSCSALTRRRGFSTFHSTCVRILRRDIGHHRYSRDFAIYDEEDSLSPR